MTALFKIMEEKNKRKKICQRDDYTSANWADVIFIALLEHT